MEYSRSKTWIVALLIAAASLYGQLETESVISQQVGDTLWVVRDTGTRVVRLVSLERVSIEPIQYSDKYNIVTSRIRRDTLGRCVEVPSRARLINVDTSRIEIRYTTVDTLPLDWSGEWVLSVEGEFERR